MLLNKRVPPVGLYGEVLSVMPTVAFYIIFSLFWYTIGFSLLTTVLSLELIIFLPLIYRLIVTLDQIVQAVA